MSQNGPADMISAIGSGGQFLNVVPSQNLVWLRMGDEPGNSNVPFLLNDNIWEYVNDLVCSNSGVEEEDFETKIHLYPNPANEQIVVSIEKGVLGKVVLFNQLGMKIKEIQSTAQSIAIDISNLEKGVYLISLLEKGKTMRFVKND